jgi:bacterioferritin
MKGNEALLKALNGLLSDELTAINQYMVHAEMAENWGYGKLNKAVRGRSIVEMKHAEKLIERILFLEGKPIVSVLNDIHVGGDVATEVGDNATKEMLEAILKDEDSHVNEIEEKRDQVDQMGIQNFLMTQTA